MKGLPCSLSILAQLTLYVTRATILQANRIGVKKMATANVEVTFDQVLATVRKLPNNQRARLWQMLNAEFNRDEIQRRALEAIEAIRAANG